MTDKKTAVELTPSREDIGKCEGVVRKLLSNDSKIELVFIKLSESDFPRRVFDLPDGLSLLTHVNPKVKVVWDDSLDISDECNMVQLVDLDNKAVGTIWQNIQASHEFIDMTMVSVFYDAGINELRKVATRKAVGKWLEQYHLPKEMMFIELGFNGVFTFSKEDFPEQIDYIRIDGTDSHKYLFQKEHLWNIAAKQAKYEKLMFVDSDIAPLKDVDWFKQVYDQLDKCLFTQGFRMIQYLDKNDANMEQAKSSYNSSYMEKKRFMGVPGGVYCLQKNTLQMIGYFNYLPFGGGDDLFWSEIMGMDRRPYILFDTRQHVKNILEYHSQETGKPLLGNVSVNIVHFYHGDRAQRSYKHRHFVLMTQYPWKDSIITDDENGILMWVNTKHRFVDVIRHLPEMNDDIDRIQGFMSGIIDYRGFYEDFISVYNDRNKFQDKARVDIIRLIQSLISKHEVKGTGSSFNFDVVVSFTSYLKRLCNDEIYLFLDSIMNQKCSKVKYHVVCTLFKGDYDKIPEKVLRYFVEHGIEVILCDDDWKSHKKYLYAMQKYRDYPVITVDDDAVYEDDMIESLYRDHMENPDMIVGRRIRKINFDLQGHATKYNSWQFVEGEKPSIDLFATTGGGTLFPPSFCKIIDKSTPAEINRTGTMSCDDFFMHYLAQKNGIMTKCVKYLNRKTKFFRGYMKNSLSMALDPGALWASNIKNNDDFVYLFDKRTGKEDDANGK